MAAPGVNARSVATSVLDNDVMMPMMAVPGRADYDDSVPAVMPTPVVVKGYGVMPAVMQAVAVFVDDLDIAMVPMMRCNDDVSFRSRSHRGQRHEKRQGAYDYFVHRLSPHVYASLWKTSMCHSIPITLPCSNIDAGSCSMKG